jgi:RNA polymerase sigma-70 factor (ECF subfamily)
MPRAASDEHPVQLSGFTPLQEFARFLGSEEASVTTPTRTLTGEVSEAEAIIGAKQGDDQCFEFLYSRHKKRVFSLCLRMTGSVEAAEDLTQEAFLLLFRKVATFRGDSAFSTWLHRLAVNVVLMHIRKRGLLEVSLEETQEPNDDGDAPRDFGKHDPILAGSIDRVVLESAIQTLAPGYRMIFVLHDIEGYEHCEIAEILGCSIGNSKSQLHKARTNLRSLLNVTCAERTRRKTPQKITNRQGVTLGKSVAASAA